ncbi:MAG: 2-oxoacid:acceptor oxidoreductase subunit alpha [Gemmatimonadales bacterium]|nr:2-oxoacid:acceptor oxidoreductase subunit alpha [Gemmatimonadales bacterium]MYH09271.1 2-oxoacid:acceptor oxidoreductase subunit alpha [Gemmatimonadales bacterium]
MPEMKTGRVNDFALKIGTVNGTGSASANGLIMQSIFRMGVPVSGKNVFPSNIQGLPTWYEIRVNGSGHVARTPDFDLIVAMNPETYAQDIEELVPGGWLLYDSSWPMADTLRREEVTFLGVPLAEMCVKTFDGGRTRILMKNIAYTGALAALLDIDMEVIRGLLEETFGEKKRHLLDANFEAIRLGHDYATENFECPLPIRLEGMDATRDSILIDGNTAAALGCVYAGATVAAWYPITPSTSLVDAFTAYCRRLRVEDGTGRSKAAILQAEDELAAAGITIGAGWAGARAFTATSGAGISLMTEFIGLAYYAEVPCVFFDVERVGPSTGMPTRTQQGDILLCAYASHGDTKHVCLYPKDPAECFEFSVHAFDLAERFQTPVFVLSDLDIGMNDWVVPRFEWDDAYRPDRGKVLDSEALAEIEKFYRYLDVDGDGIPYRTIPGEDPKGAYFTRGSGHTKYGKYTEEPDEYQEVIDRIAVKIDNAAEAVPVPEIRSRPDARYGLITLGACDGAVREAIERMEAEDGLRLDYMRIRAFPFAPEVGRFIDAHDLNIVIEQNRDAQLKSLLTLETPASKERLASVLRYGGLPLSARHVIAGVKDRLGLAAETAEGVGA